MTTLTSLAARLLDQKPGGVARSGRPRQRLNARNRPENSPKSLRDLAALRIPFGRALRFALRVPVHSGNALRRTGNRDPFPARTFFAGDPDREPHREGDRESRQESDAYDECLLTGADRHSVCENMENSPFMCSAGFIAGQADIVADRELGLARESEDCADAKGVTGCSGEQWDDWCAERYTQYYDRRILERCLFARP